MNGFERGESRKSFLEITEESIKNLDLGKIEKLLRITPVSALNVLASRVNPKYFEFEFVEGEGFTDKNLSREQIISNLSEEKGRLMAGRLSQFKSEILSDRDWQEIVEMSFQRLKAEFLEEEEPQNVTRFWDEQERKREILANRSSELLEEEESGEAGTRSTYSESREIDDGYARYQTQTKKGSSSKSVKAKKLLGKFLDSKNKIKGKK